MSTIPKGGLILVTGITGFIASWTARYLLEAGYRVRGTARTTSKAEYLKKNALKDYADKLEIVQVNDLQDEGAFNEAVKGVDGIAHIASPFHFNVTDPYKDLINPAVNGTLNLLNAAKDHAGPQLKHVVITSSFAAIMEPKPAGSEYSEADWNESSIKLCETKPANEVPAPEAYRASKSLAEKALWKFRDQHSPFFSTSAVNPPFVFGPVIHQISNPESINTSVNLLYQYLAGQKKAVQEQTPVQAFVDVRDVATAHIRALEREGTDGKRFFTVNTNFSWEETVEILRDAYPQYKDKIPEGGVSKVKISKMNNSLSKQVLGLEYIDLKTSILDTAKSLEQFL